MRNTRLFRMPKCLLSIGLVFFLCSIHFSAQAQQLPYASQFNETRAVWNPAATAIHKDVRSQVFLREQWLGFNNAPRTGFLSVEYPFIDYNMSAGLGLIFDSSGPVSKVGIQLNYAYKINGIFSDDGQLSGGLSAVFTQYSFDPDKTVIREKEDPIALSGQSAGFFPGATIGLFYISNPDLRGRDNAFFFGCSYAQIYSGEILINGSNQERSSHIFVEVGKRFQGYDSFVESSLKFNYSNPELAILTFNTQYEMHDSFWGGLGFTSTKELSIQGGVIIPDFGTRYGYLRLGALASFGLGERASEFGNGIEALVSYIYELD